MTSPQFRRKPGRNDPVSAEELMRKCEAWAMLVSQLDDYRIAGNQQGITRVLNRLYHSVEQIRTRYAVVGPQPPPFDAQAWERRVLAQETAMARESEANKP